MKPSTCSSLNSADSESSYPQSPLEENDYKLHCVPQCKVFLLKVTNPKKHFSIQKCKAITNPLFVSLNKLPTLNFPASKVQVM